MYLFYAITLPNSCTASTNIGFSPEPDPQNTQIFVIRQLEYSIINVLKICYAEKKEEDLYLKT